jgi:hypothetical protein
MAKTKGAGLLMVWAEVPSDQEDDFNRWYKEEHLAERLSVPGVLAAARYEAVQSGPKHLACYELESPDVLTTPEYLRHIEDPTEWSQRVSPSVIGTVYIRNVYEMIYPESLDSEAESSGMAPALQIGRMGIPEDIEADWNDWYSTVYVPNYEKVPEVIRGRRFRSVSGEPKYLTVYEFEHPEVSRTDEWAVQQNIDPRNAAMRTAMDHVPGSPGIWKKTFELD